jgi:triacylglycerol lipase
LQQAEADAPRAPLTCYFSHCDNIVFPARNATLAEATNHHVPGVAHVELAFHAPIFDDVMRRVRT